MVKEIYVSIGKKMEFKKYNKYEAPLGWTRIDLLKKKVKTNKSFKAKFSKKELDLLRRK